MHILITVLVCFFAGMGAGLGTGFAGMSAAAVISPMLITFLGMDPYLAVGIALSSDVLASAVSAYTYGKNKNLDIRNGLIMMASVLAFTVVGSYIASIVPSATMGSFSVVMTFLLGVKFIVRPVMTTKEAMQSISAKKRAVQSVVMLLNNTYYNRFGQRIGNRLLEAKEIAQLSGKPEQLTAYQTIPLLFLDDLGREPTEVMRYGNVTSPITELLEYRYNQRLTTIVTTNLEPSEIREKYGDRIADRFNEMFVVVSYTGNSYRC